MEFWGIPGPPYYGIGATIRIGRETLCLSYVGFLFITVSFIDQLFSITLIQSMVQRRTNQILIQRCRNLMVEEGAFSNKKDYVTIFLGDCKTERTSKSHYRFKS